MKTLPDFKTKKELFKFLVKNKEILTAQKIAVPKFQDCCIPYTNTFWDRNTKQIFKADEGFDPNVSELKARCIINTTNYLDNHSDVHLPGIWDKTLNENKMIMHIQEHVMKFSNIISEGKDLQVRVQNFTWNELGFDYPGQTQALVFDSTIKKSRNEFMFDQYRQGYVKNHSVGMRYMSGKLILCINDKDSGAEFEAWNKYIEFVANREKAEDQGYFWAVKEAGLIEGSAVPIGSNIATPTIEVSEKGLQPDESTEEDEQQPDKSTVANKINLLLFS